MLRINFSNPFIFLVLSAWSKYLNIYSTLFVCDTKENYKSAAGLKASNSIVGSCYSSENGYDINIVRS